MTQINIGSFEEVSSARDLMGRIRKQRKNVPPDLSDATCIQLGSDMLLLGRLTDEEAVMALTLEVLCEEVRSMGLDWVWEHATASTERVKCELLNDWISELLGRLGGSIRSRYNTQLQDLTRGERIKIGPQNIIVIFTHRGRGAYV